MGKRFETKFDDGRIEVTANDVYGKKDTVVLEKGQVEESLIPLMKKLPGDFIYAAGKNGIRIKIDNSMGKNAYWSMAENCIAISDPLSGDPFTFAHELGHMLDYTLLNNLHDDTKLKETFQKELDAYKAQATGLNEEEILYFISKNHQNNGGCLTELIAETNAILSGLQHDDNFLLVRAKILQENFPETMAYIGSKIPDAFV